jgi:hypothetical protein
VEQLFHGLSRNEDALNYRAAQRTLEGRYLFVEQDVLDPADLMVQAMPGAEGMPVERGVAPAG